MLPRSDGTFEVVVHINNDGYKVDLLGDYSVSATFNVTCLSPYLDEGCHKDVRANSSQQREDDGGPSIIPSLGPLGSQGGPTHKPKAKAQTKHQQTHAHQLTDARSIPGYSLQKGRVLCI